MDIYDDKYDVQLFGATSSDAHTYVKYSVLPCDQAENDAANNGVICETDIFEVAEYFNLNPVSFSWIDEYIGKIAVAAYK